jgi:hypothetical protein
VIRTSENDPIRVAFVDPASHGLPGSLGLTFAPGKCGPGVYATWERDLAMDLVRLRDEYGTRVLVTLIEEHEMREAGIPDLRRAVGRAGMTSLWFPIADVSTPRRPQDPIPLVGRILRHLTAGDTVVVHCMGGLGRAGTIASCVLAARGVEPARAIALVRAVRPGAVQTPTQAEFVQLFRDAWRRDGA